MNLRAELAALWQDNSPVWFAVLLAFGGLIGYVVAVVTGMIPELPGEILK